MLAREIRPEMRGAGLPLAPPTLAQDLAWGEAQSGARSRSPSREPMRLLADGLRVADVLVVIVASAVAYLLRHGPVALPLEITSTTLLAAALTFKVMHVAGADGRHLRAGVAEQIGRAARAWSLLFAAMLLLAYLTKTSTDYSRVWAGGWYALALVGFVATRLVAASRLRYWRRRGRLARTVAIVDLAANGEELACQLQRQQLDLRLVGIFSGHSLPHRAGGSGNGSGIDELIALSRLFRIDDVVVATAGRRPGDVDALLRRLGTIPTNVHLCPELPELAVTPRGAGLVLGRPMLTVHHRPLTGWSGVGKRWEDIVLAGLLLVLLAPLMLAVAVLIRLDSPGAVLFRQKRAGFNNNEFEVFKFRSMRERPEPEAEVPQASRDDPRVTRVGRIIRRTSIDELPQLLNVLRGEMSLVGPRPHALAHNERYAALIDDYLGRHRVQPGITGWAQIHGLRGETRTLDQMRRRVEYDVAYIDNWSILLDLKILFLTPILALFDRNAY